MCQPTMAVQQAPPGSSWFNFSAWSCGSFGPKVGAGPHSAQHFRSEANILPKLRLKSQKEFLSFPQDENKAGLLEERQCWRRWKASQGSIKGPKSGPAGKGGPLSGKTAWVHKERSEPMAYYRWRSEEAWVPGKGEARGQRFPEGTSWRSWVWQHHVPLASALRHGQPPLSEPSPGTDDKF